MPRDIDLEMKAENPRVPEMDEETKQKLIEFAKVMGSGFIPGDPYGSYKVYEKEGKDTEALVKAVGNAAESLLAQAALAGLGVAGKQLYSTMKSARAAKKAASAIPKNVKGLPKQTVDLNEEQIARLKKAEAPKSEMAVEQRMQSKAPKTEMTAEEKISVIDEEIQQSGNDLLAAKRERKALTKEKESGKLLRSEEELDDRLKELDTFINETADNIARKNVEKYRLYDQTVSGKQAVDKKLLKEMERFSEAERELKTIDGVIKEVKKTLATKADITPSERFAYELRIDELNKSRNVIMNQLSEMSKKIPKASIALPTLPFMSEEKNDRSDAIKSLMKKR